MADNPSDFIDFNAWKDLTGQSESEALQRQQADVEGKTAEAQRLLALSEQRASGDRYRGNLNATMQQQGTYADYMKAKQAAVNARELMNQRTGESGATAGAMDVAGGYSTGAQSALDRLRAMEAKAGASDASGQSGMMASKASSDARIQAQKDADALRAADFAEKQKGYLDALYGKWSKFGTGENSRTGLGGSERTQWAQQLSTAQDRGVWTPDGSAAIPGGRRNGAIENAAWGTSILPGGYAAPRRGPHYVTAEERARDPKHNG